MAFQPTIDGALVVVPFSGNGYNWSNHLWFSKEDFDTADMLALALAVEAVYYNELDGFINDDYQYCPCTVYDMRTEDGPIVIGTGGGQTGNGADDPLPPAMALVATLRTAKRGRSYRGRTFIAGMGETSQTAGSFGGSAVTAVEDWGAAMMTTPLVQGWTFCVRSGQLNGVLRENAVVEPVIAVEVRSPKPGSQRRRTNRS